MGMKKLNLVSEYSKVDSFFILEHGYDSINFLWEASPMNTKNDFKF